MTTHFSSDLKGKREREMKNLGFSLLFKIYYFPIPLVCQNHNGFLLLLCLLLSLFEWVHILMA